MFHIEKRFTLPIGHRLSKHKGRCASIHGHNFTILVGIAYFQLNKNDMLIDFTELKSLVNNILDSYDHSLLVNKVDIEWLEPLSEKLNLRAHIFDNNNYDPTAERLSEQLFLKLKAIFTPYEFKIDYVTVYENENSKATYSEEWK